jgi:hypothetical protein
MIPIVVLLWIDVEDPDEEEEEEYDMLDPPDQQH